MRVSTMIAFLCAAGGAAIAQQPAIDHGGVLNAASDVYVGLPGSGIAQGSIFSLYGSNMGPATGVEAKSFPLQTMLSQVSVSVTVSGTTVAALPLYVSGGFLKALLPSNTPAGTGTVTVTYNGNTSATEPITVVQSTFGITALNSAGSGPAVAQNASQNLSIVTATNPAHPNDVLILWGTGSGPVAFDEKNPPTKAVNLEPAIHAQLWLGGESVIPSYVGRSGCCSGADQVNFKIPAGVMGCHVPLALQIGNTISNYTSLAIAPRGQNACSDPIGYSASDIQRLQSQGNLRVGRLSLNRISLKISAGGVSVDQVSDSGSGQFKKYDSATFNRSAGYQIPTIGSCFVSYLNDQTVGNGDPIIAVGLDAGPAISVTANGVVGQLKAAAAVPGFDTKGDYYSNQLPKGYLDNAGPFIFNNGSGGSDVGPFTFSMSPGAILTPQLDNINTIDRSQGLAVSWTGGDPSGFVLINGSSQIPAAGSASSNIIASFSCIAPVTPATFTVPSSVLMAMPATPSGTPFGGLLMVGGISGITVASQLPAGLDVLTGMEFVLGGKTVTWQ